MAYHYPDGSILQRNTIVAIFRKIYTKLFFRNISDFFLQFKSDLFVEHVMKHCFLIPVLHKYDRPVAKCDL